MHSLRSYLESAPQAASQLLLQPRRGHLAATRQRPDHHLIGLMEITQHRSGDMPQPTRDPMAFDGRPHRLADDQSDARALALVTIAAAPNVNDDIGLRGAHPVPHGRVELR
jgi:hypothetical protein